MRRSSTIQSRSGYALLMCLMVVAVTSSIVLTLFQALRLQTAEATARRQVVIRQALGDGALEHALAILLDNPSFAGQSTVRIPAMPDASYTLDVQQNGTNITISANLPSGATSQIVTRTVSVVALQQRRQNLGLQ